MRAPSVVAVCAVALVVVAAAAADFQSSASVNQGAITAAQIAAPSGLATSKACTKTPASYTITFMWTAPSPTTYVDGYQIYSGTVPGTHGTLVATVSGVAQTSFTTPARTDFGANLYFVVRATARSWYSADSAEVAFTAPTNMNNCK